MIFDLVLHLKFVGLLLIAIGLAHVLYSQKFNWKEEFSRVSLINRQIFYVHCFFLVLVLVLQGILLLFFTDALLEKTQLGKLLLIGLVIFWGCRLLFQFFVYDSSLWKGSAFHTRMHILFALLWCYLTGVFSWALWHQLQT